MSNTRRTQPWPEVVDFYSESIGEGFRSRQPMLALVQFLASSRYARSLFPSVSEEGLVIGRTPNFQAGEGELRIRFDAEAQEFRFTHQQRPDDVNPWSRVCAGDEWRQVLERLLHKRLQWFHEG